MTKSALELFNKAGELIGVKAAGQALAAEDLEAFSLTIDPLLAELNANGVAYVYVNTDDMSEETIEDSAFLPLARILANELAPSFGRDAVEGRDRDLLWNRLRRVVAAGPTYDRQQTDYY